MLKPNMNLSWYAYGLRENNALQLNLFGQQDDAESLTRRHFQVAKLHWYNTAWSFTVNAAGDFSRNEFRFGNLDNRERSQRWYGSFNARYNVINNWYLQGGVTSEHTQLRLQGQVAEQPFNFAAEAPTRSLNQERSNNNTELYLISRSKWFDKKFSFITGLRKNIPTSALQNSYFSRQYIAKYNFPSKHAIAATFGNYNGYFNPDLFNPEFVQVSARQGALEYEYRSKKLEINAAVFGKTETGGFNQLLQLANFAEQRIQGLELLWKYRWSPRFECWLSSAYLNVENRNAEGLNFRGSVECANLLEEALLIAERLRPDILLLDNNLPDGLGLNFVEKFKSINPEMYVILFSAMDLHREAIVAGADVFLGKPLDLGVIREVMRR